MKKLVFVLSLVAALALPSLGQQPRGGGPGGPGGAGAGRGAPGGGASGGGGAPGGGGQRGAAGRGAPAPPATGPIADLVNKIVDLVNKQDRTELEKIVPADAVWLDEDGHMFPARTWMARLLQGTPPKKFTIVATPAPLRVGDITADTAWAGFNYTLDETVTPRGQSAAVQNQMKGLASIVFKKVGNDWQVALIHVPVYGPALATH